jgi:DNA end-binding protein Ku
VGFHLLHDSTHNRIRMVPTDPETGPVDRADIVKGYEVDKDQYVVVTDDEIAAVRLESTRTIDIDRFVAADDIDRLYWDEPYFLVPDGKMAEEAYGVIREAMRRTKRVALGRVVMHTRERLLAMEPRDAGMLAYSLRSADEVRDPAEAFEDISARAPDPKMIEIAERIIEQLAGRFDPSTFTDRYEDALRALIREKQKGGAGPVRVEEPEDTKVVDLMQALRRSLGEHGGAGQRRTPERKPRKSRAQPTQARRRAS